jgi:uncharacterized membrane protein YdjX (TVP38/TMEM64 family)
MLNDPSAVAAPAEGATDDSRPITDWIRLAIPVVVVAALIVTAWRLGYFNIKTPAQLDAATDRVEGAPWLVPLFILLYAGLATLAAPVSPLAYGAGALFGVTRGTLYVWAASILGASAGYYLARSAWSGPARRLLGRFHDKLRQLREGNTFLMALRLQVLPVLPFGVFNYAAGVARVPFLGFIGGTGLGILPGTIAAVYVGDRLIAGLQGNDRRAFVIAGVVVVAMFGLSFAPTVVTRIRRASNH